MVAGKNVSAKDHQATERLRKYWTTGEGGKLVAKWGQPGDFDRCVAALSKHLKDPKGYCAQRHFDALGIWPATHAKDLRGGKKK
jgi:hypothetical protein